MEQEIKDKILNIFSDNVAIHIATSGGEYSPWILGAYFAYDGLDIYCVLETHGKSFSNVSVNRNIAIEISQNDASKDFLQGFGVVEILPQSDTEKVLKMITDRIPWFKTYTPIVPVKLNISKYFVSSLAEGWFPAKVYEKRA
ncbi:MAG: hypothetical protein OZ913_05405 [Ignavibacteriaceae bacterium]|jgi:nitroimidazol reductase NimA-like FMN-containing flavoprotein (pyridoxamine 5'-phosphate oxidase superfamily)|nr:MAG: hypothetical protein EDM69_02250 [Chlorobiota bacterium]KXK02436.1 MAG: hypothetical protein UZ04_CHB001001729 [Chlorobi bacterium OLB4]MBV6398032.1 hypothetical protein [Ignavibacteria bacterium]MCC6886480.1 hypothetical protein [Ignavibacteriales bacterium]MCE7952444.1 hypothetical protein [Chlorobi bacterium CHB7]MDL1886561.1 hypothetical protein [Ignavibacteria bacterium CHB1]MEB2329721.1 hypothetical protein [Ignavibacteriaceae bacterium]OQY77339.1 MAG: hypothetical protein B6D4